MSMALNPQGWFMAEDAEKISWKKRKRLEHKLRLVEKRDRMLRKNRSSERAVLEEVFDHSTRMTIYYLMNQGKIKDLCGVVSAGKEAKIYWGVDSSGKDLAVKIYLVVSAEFKKGMLIYIKGDPRFKRVKRDTKSLIYAWAQKEFKNLRRAYKAGVRVPKPVAVSKNVLIMEFIGKDGLPAPLMRETILEKPEVTYKMLLEYVKRLYQRAKLVHADLSEYNIMMLGGEPVIFDVSQSVLVEHPLAETFLKRDLQNLNRYFLGLNVEVTPVEKAYRWVTKGD